jgi:hypothetical protein
MLAKSVAHRKGVEEAAVVLEFLPNADANPHR